jgi:hypothetical protein
MHPAEFIFDHPSGLRISRDLLEADVASIAGVGRRDMGTGYVWYSLPIWSCGCDHIVMSLCFQSGSLDSISIALNDPDSGSCWSDWAEEKERTRADLTEGWLAAQGYPTGTYSWGEVWAAYDSRGGSGSAGIRYKRQQDGGGELTAGPESNLSPEDHHKPC